MASLYLYSYKCIHISLQNAKIEIVQLDNSSVSYNSWNDNSYCILPISYIIQAGIIL